MKDDPKALKPLVDAAKAAGTPMTFAMTFPPGTHAMWMRYYLAAGGIHPGDAQGGGADISLITVPPPQMVANMKVGKMDGYCVGEPWNARAIADDIGFTAINTQDIWKDHPEKVCAFTAEFADKNPKTVKAVLKALHEASVWLDKMENRPEQAQIVSAADLHQLPAGDHPRPLAGQVRHGRRPQVPRPELHDLQRAELQLSAAEVLRSGGSRSFAAGASRKARRTTKASPKEVMRPDIYEEAMKEIGYAHGGVDDKPETLFDGETFDPKSDLEAYAASFDVNSHRKADEDRKPQSTMNEIHPQRRLTLADSLTARLG